MAITSVPEDVLDLFYFNYGFQIRHNVEIKSVVSVEFSSLQVATSVSIRTDEIVYAITAKSLLPYMTSALNFWDVIHAKLFAKLLS